jgi:hypothetical protein
VATSVYDTLVWASLRERGIPEKEKRQKVLVVTRSFDPNFDEKPRVRVLLDEGKEVTQVVNTREDVAKLILRSGRVEEYFGTIIFDEQGEGFTDMEETFKDFAWRATQR